MTEYRVHIVDECHYEYYLEAESAQDALEQAWQIVPHDTPDYNDTDQSVWAVDERGNELEVSLEDEPESRLVRGTQILRVPPHAKGNLDHPDVESGFVVRYTNGIAHCRYWSRHDPHELRTRANSEATDPMDLVLCTTRMQDEVDEMLERIERDEI